MFYQSFIHQLDAKYICVILFLFLIIAFRLGYLLRVVNIKKGRLTADKNLGTLEGALLGLLALLLSFTFSMSGARHDKRISVIIEEANDIGTVILRADLYPDSLRNAFRKDLKDYVENRIAFFEVGEDISKIEAVLKQGEVLQSKLWNRAAMEGRNRENVHQTAQMIPALNAMIDITTTRNAVNIDKVPNVVIYLLLIICITCSFMVGYASQSRPDWVVMIGFSIMISFTVFLIIDLDRPRKGIITLNSVNTQMLQLREMFKNDR
jgi:hypothetical protein